ncbi:MAG TPA: response regulator transcription factor [Nannocystis sp.]
MTPQPSTNTLSQGTGTEDQLASPARVVIVDDHPIFRLGLAQLLAAEPDLEVVGEAEDADAALALLRERQVDLAVIDLSLKNGSGIDLIKQIRAAWPDLKLLVLSMHDEQLFGERVLRAGAHGYLMKHVPADRIVGAVRKSLRGELAVSEQLAENMLNAMVSRPRAGTGIENLSDRELEVFELLGRGHDTRNIAESLKISIKTVETHQSNLKLKLGAHSAHQLRRLAVLWATEGLANSQHSANRS